MASTNQSPFYQKAELNFLNAKTDEDKLYWLDEMIRECPKHKSAEKMLANLKTRRIKLIEKIDRIKRVKRSGKSSKESIKKHELQAVLIGFTNSGKSSLLKAITNAYPKISPNNFTTKEPLQGMMNYKGVSIQVIDQPSLKGENFDIGLVNNTDLLLEVITNVEEIKEIDNYLVKFKGEKIIVFNKSDILNEDEKRKISANLSSKKYNFVLVSTDTEEGLEILKNKMLQSFKILKIYLKEPDKSEPSKIPMTIKSPATIKNIAEKIGKNFLASVKEIHIWGPSSKFPNQKVGLNHELKDNDIVEFKTR